MTQKTEELEIERKEGWINKTEWWLNSKMTQETLESEGLKAEKRRLKKQTLPKDWRKKTQKRHDLQFPCLMLVAHIFVFEFILYLQETEFYRWMTVGMRISRINALEAKKLYSCRCKKWMKKMLLIFCLFFMPCKLRLETDRNIDDDEKAKLLLCCAVAGLYWPK